MSEVAAESAGESADKGAGKGIGATGKPSLYILDALNFLFRAFHALPPLKTTKGTQTGAINFSGKDSRFENVWFDFGGTPRAAYFTVYITGDGNVVNGCSIERGLGDQAPSWSSSRYDSVATPSAAAIGSKSG